jgi:hypothetical protein
MFSHGQSLLLERWLVLQPQSGWDETQAAEYQPMATLLGTLLGDINILAWHILNSFDVDECIQVKILSNSHDMYNKAACAFSPMPNHLVAQLAYNKMMGEFYIRTIRGLN